MQLLFSICIITTCAYQQLYASQASAAKTQEGLTLNSAQQYELNTKLIAAIKAKDIQAVQENLKAGAEANVIDYSHTWGIPIIFYADAQTIPLLATAGARIDETDASGQTALMQAASNCKYDTIDALLQAGADINARNNQGSTALHNALITAGAYDIVKLLVSKGADVTLPTKAHRRNAFDELTLFGRTKRNEILQAIKEGLAKYEQNAELLNVAQSRMLKLAQEMLQETEQKYIVTPEQKHLNEQFFAAIKDKSTPFEQIKKLLPTVKLDAVDDQGRSPLILAVIANRAKVIDAILKQIVKEQKDWIKNYSPGLEIYGPIVPPHNPINDKDNSGKTALQWARTLNNEHLQHKIYRALELRFDAEPYQNPEPVSITKTMTIEEEVD